MNKLFLFLLTILSITTASAQTSVNADGTIKHRGNVAIIVEGRNFTFSDGNFVKTIDDETMQMLKTTLRALSIQKFSNMNFGIVNRDDEANSQVKQLIEENKLEDYLDGISVQAKNQGADYLFLVDITNYGENEAAFQTEIATRLISITNNFGYHKLYRSAAIGLGEEADMREQARKLIKEFEASLDEQITEVFPEQYFIAQADGKTWNLGAYQPNGMIQSNDKFYAFRLSKNNMQIANSTVPIQILDEVGVASNPKGVGGYVQVKANNNVGNTSDIVVFRNLRHPIFSGTNQMAVTFFGLQYELDSYEGLTKRRINNAVYSAITENVGTQLIEHDHLPEIRAERELQKSEDFLDGHVVEQMKAIGAQYLIKLENFVMNGTQVSFKMSFISVAQNQIARTVDIVSSIDNIENEMYKQLCERFAWPCVISSVTGKTLELSSIITLKDGVDCVLQLTKAIKNPINGEVSYSRNDVCKMELKEYHGNKSVMTIGKVISKDDMKDLENMSKNGYVTFRVDGSNIKSDISTTSQVQEKAKKEEKKQKVKSILGKLGGALLRNTSVK